ncbi:DUF1826 domain-containing protein [Methyloversatilis sp.]|uniref:DUF1826 domain-containing protein n=1 Tax=Methyloversatilis sp. TaxID=2569862 RepID=UPI003F71CD1E
MYIPVTPLCPVTRDVSEAADLALVLDPDCNLVRLARSLPAGLADCLQAAHAAGILRSGLRAELAPGETLPLDTLPDLPGRDALREEVRQLASLLADLTDCPKVALRIEVLERAMCPRLHVDHVGLRLLCTWIGPATEWLADADADRSRLGTDDVMPDPSALRRADAGDILVLKGEGWPGNAGHGVIHRSPALTPAQPLRIIAALDALFPVS